MLYSDGFYTPAMAMGRRWEDKAFHRYKEVIQEEHKCFQLSKCGLFISEDIYHGASPDGVITCECHNEGLLELKCAIKFWSQDPKSQEVIEKLPYLINSIDGPEVNKKHRYYSQVQFQMGITGKLWCHLVVFTSACLADEVPPLMVTVKFDEDHLKELLTSCREFWLE